MVGREEDQIQRNIRELAGKTREEWEAGLDDMATDLMRSSVPGWDDLPVNERLRLLRIAKEQGLNEL